MAQESADLVCSAGRQDVLELTGLLLDFRLAVHGEAVRKQALCQSMATDDATGFAAAARRQQNESAAVELEDSFRAHRIMAGIYERLVMVRLGWMR